VEVGDFEEVALLLFEDGIVGIFFFVLGSIGEADVGGLELCARDETSDEPLAIAGEGVLPVVDEEEGGGFSCGGLGDLGGGAGFGVVEEEIAGVGEKAEGVVLAPIARSSKEGSRVFWGDFGGFGVRVGEEDEVLIGEVASDEPGSAGGELDD